MSASQLSGTEIKAILRRENELRLHPQTQRRFAAASRVIGGDGWLTVVDDLQRQVAIEFGLTEQVGLAAMRDAEALLPGDNEVIEISLYRKFNRCVDGKLSPGDAAPDAKLVAVGDERVTTVHSLLECSSGLDETHRKPLVVLAGSYT